MAIKIEIIGGALVCTDTITSEIVISQPSKDIWYKENDLDSLDRISFYDSNGISGGAVNSIELPTIQLSDAVDVNLSGFVASTFREFATNFLGYDAIFKSPAFISSLGIVLENRVIVTQANYLTTICGVIDSTKAYFLDGIIDIGSTPITVPSTGINIKGFDFNTSGLKSTANSYTMFISPVGNSGDVILDKLFIQVSGTGSKVFNLTDANGFHALEWTAINFIACTSLGDVYSYRQGLETGTGRFGGSPSLTLHGTWIGGFKITTSLTRSMSNTTTAPMFKAGTAFVMNSRFYTDMNVNLGTLQPFLDFSSANFLNPSTLQLRDMEITRGFVYNPLDANMMPNIDHTSLASSWNGNNGLTNTHEGGFMAITTEAVTTIPVAGTYYELAGTRTASDLQHFEMVTNGHLRNLGNNPREFKIITYVVITGSNGDVINVRVRKYDSATLVTSTVISQQATVNNFQGQTDGCTFSILGRTTLNKNDHYFLEVTNITSARNITAKIGTFSTIEKRS